MKKMKQLMSKTLALCIAGLLCFGFFGVNEVKAQTINTLKVATYNVESPRPDDDPGETLPRIVAEHIKDLASNPSPDVWGLSEVPNRTAAEIYREAAEYDGSDFKLIFGTTGSFDDKLAILFNQNRLQQIGSSRELSEVEGDRNPLVAQFRSIPDETEFLVVVNHFNRGSTRTRNKQATNLRNWIEDQSLPVIALGDFNMDYSVDLSFRQPSGCRGTIEEGNEAFDIFTGSDQIEWIRPQCLADGTCPPLGTGCFRCFNSILDFVFVGGSSASNWSGTSEIGFKDDSSYCSNDPLGDTDHRPVLATLTFAERTSGNGGTGGTSETVSNLKIVEIFPNPVGGSSSEIVSETVTIANLGDDDVSLDGWQLRDRANTTWSLFGTINSGQKIEFRRNSQPMALNNSGDTINLLNPTGTIVDEATYFSSVEGQAIVFN
jgi:hypothetical protein